MYLDTEREVFVCAIQDVNASNERDELGEYFVVPRTRQFSRLA